MRHRGRLDADQVDHPADGAAAVEPALGAAHHLDALEAGEAEQLDLRVARDAAGVGDRDAVLEHLGLGRTGAAQAQLDGAGEAAAALDDIDAGEVAQPVDGEQLVAGEAVVGAGDDIDAGGGALLRFALAIGGDDDGALGAGGRRRSGGGGRGRCGLLAGQAARAGGEGGAQPPGAGDGGMRRPLMMTDAWGAFPDGVAGSRAAAR